MKLIQSICDHSYWLLTYCPLIAFISMNLSIHSHNLVTNRWNFMKLIVIIYRQCHDCRYSDATIVSDIQELMPFDCIYFNELVPTEP